MAECLLGLGSNLGDRAANLDRAVSLLSSHAQVTLVARSTNYATAPIGGPAGQAGFLNAAARVTTALAPRQLLHWTREVERRLGRQRRIRWGPRTIDIDLLLVNRLVLETAELALPHPRMVVRRFVLEPACEIASEMVHPLTGWSLARLLEHLDHSSPYIALAGPPCSGKTTLAHAVARQAGVAAVLEPTPAAAATERGCRGHEPADTWDAALAQAQARRMLVDALPARFRASGAAWLVSDFWLAQTPLAATTCYDGQATVAAEEAWKRVVANSTAPRLVVLLDEEPAKVVERLQNSWDTPVPEQLVQQLELYCARLRQQACTPGHGPVVKTPADLRQATIELTAAMDAMIEGSR